MAQGGCRRGKGLERLGIPEMTAVGLPRSCRVKLPSSMLALAILTLMTRSSHVFCLRRDSTVESYEHGQMPLRFQRRGGRHAFPI